MWGSQNVSIKTWIRAGKLNEKIEIRSEMHPRLPVFYGLKIRIKEKLIIVDVFDYIR